MKDLVRRMVIGGSAAGMFDIFAACLIYHVGPMPALRGVASGVLGHAARNGGVTAAMLGLGLQLLMSLLMAAIYGVAALRLRRPLSKPIAWGLLYGIVIFMVMNFIVLPLSAIGHAPHFTTSLFLSNLLAMLAFGLIIAFSASFSRQSRSDEEIGPAA